MALPLPVSYRSLRLRPRRKGMRKCPWCGFENLNVYAYCQRCGRGFEGPEQKKPGPSLLSKLWPFGRRAA
jgi:hypothetical protein